MVRGLWVVSDGGDDLVEVAFEDFCISLDDGGAIADLKDDGGATGLSVDKLAVKTHADSSELIAEG